MRRAGFTLIEMLAVMFLLSLVMTAAVNVYLDLSRQSNAAAEHTRHVRRAVALLDRIARELEAAVLVVKPGEVDPLDHPWVFLAEGGRGGEGADRIKFVTRSHVPRTSAGHESDLAMVAYVLREEGSDGGELLRWSSPRLPEGLDRSFPREADPGAFVLADDVAGFGVRFLTEDGEWKKEWDSSSLVDSSQLPLAAEIQVSFYRAVPGDEPAVAGPFTRQVILPVRPLDLEVLLGRAVPGEGGEEEDDEDLEGDGEGGCVTVAQCMEAHPEFDPGLTPNELEQVAGDCASEYASKAPIPDDCL